jgi:DNA-binding transcriptional LysR family regulator
MALMDQRLRIFLKVAETGSFTEAAKSLGLSQPAVSQSVSLLEKTLGTLLFERLRGEAVLTPQGRLFKSYADKIGYWSNAAEMMFGSEGLKTVNRPVRIAADSISAAYIVPPALSVLREANPNLNFVIEPLKEAAPDLFEENSGTRVEVDGGVPQTHFGTPQDADVEVTVAPSPKTMDFEGESRLAGVMEAAVVTSKLNRGLAMAAIGDGGDGQRPFSTIAGIPVRNRIAAWSGYEKLLEPDVAARVALTSVSVEAVKTMTILSSDIAAVVPEAAVKREVAEGNLLRLPISLPDFTFDIHYNPLPEFAERDVSKLLQEAIRTGNE